MKRDIVVIGASSGGVEALQAILSKLPKELEASLFITIHTTPTGPSYLADILSAVCPLPVVVPVENEQIKHGRVYVATPNLHLIIKRGHIRNRFLPKENGTRPAIDPMFRSAALSYARRVIGILLTGRLDDGTAGLGVIRDEGGVTVVQDPSNAMHPDMPLSAIKNTEPDYIVPLAEIAPLIVKLADTEVAGNAPAEETDSQETTQVMTCPGCGGVVHGYTDNKSVWYQCMVGHRFTSETMMLEQNVSAEEHFWRLQSLLKEKQDLARTLATDARASVDPIVDPEYFEKQARAAAEAQTEIAGLLDRLGPHLFPGIPRKDPTKTEKSRKGEQKE